MTLRKSKNINNMYFIITKSIKIVKKKRFTSFNLVAFVDRTLSSMSTGNEVDAIYNDFSKAFDVVNHTILIKKG